MTTILKLENLNYGYEDGGFRRQILKDLSYEFEKGQFYTILGCLLYTSPSPRDRQKSRMPSSA